MTVHASNTPEAIRDLWGTPRAIFDTLNTEFNFLLDVAASIENRLVSAFFSESMDALQQQWPPVPCWCNPPYSDIGPWIDKAIEASCRGATVVMLVPADTSVAWFRKAWDTAAEVRFINGRISFINAETRRPVAGNNKGSVLLIWTPEPLDGRSPRVQLIQREELLT